MISIILFYFFFALSGWLLCWLTCRDTRAPLGGSNNTSNNNNNNNNNGDEKKRGKGKCKKKKKPGRRSFETIASLLKVSANSIDHHSRVGRIKERGKPGKNSVTMATWHRIAFGNAERFCARVVIETCRNGPRPGRC